VKRSNRGIKKKGKEEREKERDGEREGERVNFVWFGGNGWICVCLLGDYGTILKRGSLRIHGGVSSSSSFLFS
jgi:hypothetical protein